MLITHTTKQASHWKNHWSPL